MLYSPVCLFTSQSPLLPVLSSLHYLFNNFWRDISFFKIVEQMQKRCRPEWRKNFHLLCYYRKSLYAFKLYIIFGALMCRSPFPLLSLALTLPQNHNHINCEMPFPSIILCPFSCFWYTLYNI